jgi:ATP-dependent DNA helicase PIF1
MNEEQAFILNVALSGRSLFMTGPGGVGKSYMIHHIRNHLRRRNVHVTALTGCAAVLIKGTTLHSWAGLNTSNSDKNADYIAETMTKKAIWRWKKTHVLIIDEVSMLSKDLFEKLSEIGQILRNNTRPFGGIQLIFSGDFLQLPPVIKCKMEDADKFAFCSSTWKTLFDNTTFELTQVMRQKDENFIRILNKIRKGTIDDEVIQTLESRMNVDLIDNIQPTQLMSMRHEVDRINDEHMLELEDDIQVHKWLTHKTCSASSKFENTVIRQWENDCQCEKSLFLAIGSQVVLIHNKFQEDYGLVNGSRGVIEGFNDDGDPIVEFKDYTLAIPKHTWEFENNNGDIKYSITQYPLKLAWALTIHKSQGMTLDCVIIDISNIFEQGQAYVALSRVKSLDGLYIKNMDPSKIKANDTVLKYFT